MSEKATVVVGGNIVPLGSDYAGTPTYRPTKVDANGLQRVGIDADTVGLAKEGTPITGVTMPTGGSGIQGWTSGLYNLFSSGTATVRFATAQQVSIGNVSTTSSGSLIDAFSPTIALQSQSFGYGYDPTAAKWQRLTVDSSKNLNVTNASGPRAITQTPSVGRVTIAAGATAVALRVGASDLASRKQFAIRNISAPGGAILYIGGANVTDAAGWPIYPGESYVVEQNPANTVTIYGYSSGACVVAVMEVA
ncbi:hypothetical protein JJB07_06170 [Tumebacillus sp. ITR2]|uniref:Tail fiber protein n=1 Tax=Tumebacillus amylolyticus TaxID=2801339 RepID=A0ABS1J7J1_9BACL|nr:hypothetical protein [Tumebacillus amylolyticus]MBL0386237.1 hypothetical protein [Tumebacillus amylolyticus]